MISAKYKFVDNYDEIQEQKKDHNIDIAPEISWGEGSFLISDVIRYWRYLEHGDDIITLVFSNNSSATVKYDKEVEDALKAYFQMRNKNPMIQ